MARVFPQNRMIPEAVSVPPPRPPPHLAQGVLSVTAGHSRCTGPQRGQNAGVREGGRPLGQACPLSSPIVRSLLAVGAHQGSAEGSLLLNLIGSFSATHESVCARLRFPGDWSPAGVHGICPGKQGVGIRASLWVFFSGKGCSPGKWGNRRWVWLPRGCLPAWPRGFLPQKRGCTPHLELAIPRWSCCCRRVEHTGWVPRFSLNVHSFICSSKHPLSFWPGPGPALGVGLRRQPGQIWSPASPTGFRVKRRNFGGGGDGYLPRKGGPSWARWS